MPYKLKPIISKKEYELLLEHTLKSKKKNKKQYALAMILGFEAGMRISEIVGLNESIHKVDNGMLEARTIEKEGKKLKKFFCTKCGQEIGINDTIMSKDRWKIPKLTSEQIDFDKNYITIRQGKGQKDRIVPLPRRVTRKSIGLLPLTLTRRSIQWYVKKIGKEVLNKDISFHTFRAGFATHALDNGVSIHHVQQMLGHSRIDTTGVYLRASPRQAVDKIREAFEQ